MFYIPNLPYAFYLAAKARHLAFFSAANPAIKSSGNGTESKFATLELIPDEFKPKSVLHNQKTPIAETLLTLKEKEISFPLITKPDVGFRGLLVTKIASETELVNYLKKHSIPIIIQEFIDLKNECGIFYFRNPNQEKGKITSITLKKFLTVIGDGTSTLKELIAANSRAKLYVDILFEQHQNSLDNILKNGETRQLSVIGNHCKGTQFLDGNYLVSNNLEEYFDVFSKSISGWYYGRIDIKYNTFKELEMGKNFKILEINGIIAEPTHIYDAENSSYFKALKAIRNHWKNLFDIATTNHNQYNIPYKSTRKFISEMIELRAYTKKVNALHKA